MLLQSLISLLLNVVTVTYFFAIEYCYSPSFLYYQMLLLTSMTSSSSSIFSVESLNFTDLVIAKTLAEQIYFHLSSPDLVFHNCPTVILSHQGLISSLSPKSLPHSCLSHDCPQSLQRHNLTRDPLSYFHFRELLFLWNRSPHYWQRSPQACLPSFHEGGLSNCEKKPFLFLKIRLVRLLLDRRSVGSRSGRVVGTKCW